LHLTNTSTGISFWFLSSTFKLIEVKFLEISSGLDDLINTSNGIISSTATLSGNLADGYLSICFRFDFCSL
jgi:hypothetical protein